MNARDISVDYEITVPADTTIRTHSGSGDQTIEGTHGNVDLQSGSGDVKLSQLTGEIRLQTGSGNVRALEISGPVRGGTGSGDIELEETAAGDVDLQRDPATLRLAASKGGFALRRAAGISRPKASRPEAGRFGQDPAMCTSGCRECSV